MRREICLLISMKESPFVISTLLVWKRYRLSTVSLWLSHGKQKYLCCACGIVHFPPFQNSLMWNVYAQMFECLKPDLDLAANAPDINTVLFFFLSIQTIVLTTKQCLSVFHCIAYRLCMFVNCWLTSITCSVTSSINAANTFSTHIFSYCDSQIS